MKTVHRIDSGLTALSCAALLALTACGGGGEDAASASATAQAQAQSQAQAASSEALADGADQAADASARAAALAAPGSPAVGTLSLVTASAAGKAAGGSSSACGISADGTWVAFGSDAAALVAGDTNQRTDVFVKNTRTGAITRVSTSSAGAQLVGGASCLAMTPDGKSVVMQTAGGSNPYLPPIEPAIVVKNLVTGTLTTVTPALSAFPTTAGYLFQSVSDDGLRVAMIATPTTTYLGGYETVANGPARALVRDLRTGELINLSTNVPLDLSQGVYDGSLLLSPDGGRLAFSTRFNIPAVGDANGKSDVFVLDLATRAVSLVSSNSAGVPAVVSGPPAYDPAYHLISFLVGGTQLAYEAPAVSTLGAAGAYRKDLGTGASKLIFASGNFALPALSISDDGTQAAFGRAIYPPNAQQIDAVWLRDLRTGQERRFNTTAAGVLGNNQARLPRLSRDGSTAIFESNATNLLPAARVGYIYETFAKTVNAAAAAPP